MSRMAIVVLSADVLIAFPGGEGTRTEVILAQDYRRPVVAYLRDRSEIQNLPPDVPVEAELAGVQRFVREYVSRGARG